MAATPVFAEEGSFLREAGFPNTAHRGTELPAGSGLLSEEEKVQKLEDSLLLELDTCPCFSHSSPVQQGSQPRKLS